MLQIRKMEWKDYLQVSWVDQIAFSNHYRKTYGITRLAERTKESIDAFVKRTGGDALVAEYNGQVVGYIFLHQWGNLGWFGAFGVDPNYQRRGIGKALVERTIQIFEERQVSEIGLETLVDSPSNIGLYMETGFQPINLNFDLARTVKVGKYASPPPPAREGVAFKHYSNLDESTFPELLTTARQLTNSVIPGLDYQPEIELMLKFGFGRVIIMEEAGEPIGLAVVKTIDLRGEDNLTVNIRGMVIKSGVSEEEELVRLSELLYQVYQTTREVGRSKVVLSVYSHYDNLTRYLIRNEKFTISFPYLRMVRYNPNYPIHKGGIEISKWRG